MSITRSIAATAAVAALGVAAPAASAATAHHGDVLELGRLTNISGSAGNDGSTFMKAFVGDRGSRVVYTDNLTGALKSESAVNPRIWKDYQASTNTLTLRDGFDEPLAQTPADEARSFQQGVAQGCFVKVGSENGLDHYKMVDQPQLPCADNPDTKVDARVDQRTGYVIERITTVGTFRQAESLAYVKEHDEPGAAKLLKLSPHPGATVVDERS
jgi:hypothetical protein